MPGDELRETRETVGDAFDGAEPGRPCANRSKKSRQNRRGCFVAPVAKQAGEANAQNGAVEPGLFLCGLGHKGAVYTTFTSVMMPPSTISSSRGSSCSMRSVDSMTTRTMGRSWERRRILSVW